MRRFSMGLTVLALAAGCRAGKSTANKDAPPAPTARSSGTIVGEVGDIEGPLAGARVCARKLNPALDYVAEDVTPTCTITNASGGFELEVTTGIYFVVAAVDEYLPRGTDVVVASTNLEPSVRLDLVPGGRAYEGIVVDLEDQPIVGARVSHVTELGPRRYAGVDVETDAQGRYRLWSTRAGYFAVHARGYAREVTASPDDRRLVLSPGSTIEGTVVDREGRPAAYARVSITGLFSPMWGWPQDAVRADADGNFVLGELAPGDHWVFALSEPDREWGGEVEVRSGQHEDVRVILDHPLRRYRARIVDADDGTPVAGCVLGLRTLEDDPSSFVWTDEEGMLDFPLAIPISIDSLSCPGYVAREPFPELVTGLPIPTRIAVRKGQALHGSVISAGGWPVAGLHVELEPSNEDLAIVSWIGEDRTDAFGRFTIRGLAPGEYKLDRASETVVIDERPWQRKTFTINLGARVEVEVGTEGIGRLVHLVQLEDCRGGPSTEVEVVATDGLAVFEDVPAGEYRVAISDASDPEAHEDDLAVTVHVAGSDVRVQLDASAPGF